MIKSFDYSLIIFFMFYNLINSLLAIVFYFLKREDYELLKMKFLIIISLISSFPFCINRFNFFIIHSINSNRGLDQYFDYILFFNISLLLLCVSFSIFILALFSRRDKEINLKCTSISQTRRGSIKIGKLVKRKRKKFDYFLRLSDLERHMFICGATGIGKSNFLQHFLVNFKSNFNIPFLIVEFKGEYQFLQKIFDDLLIMKPGENFSINIFNSQGADPAIHAERIYDILASGQFLDENAEFSPQMEKVLVEILTKVCKMDKHRNWNGFYKYCNIYSKKYRNKIPMLSQTLISITNRIRRFSLGPLKAIFDQENEIKMKNLLRKNVIIDLSSIIRLGGEKSDALFFLNMILKYLWDKNLSQGSSNYKGAKHLTIIEDVQYFAPKELNNKSKLTSYLEDIALLQRGTGECLISIATRPNISEEILANSGVFAVFKTHMHKEILGQLLNLEEEKYNFISLLDQGECIIRVNSIKEPFLLSVPLIERKSINNSFIEENNKKILSKFRE